MSAAPVSGLVERLRSYEANERHENMAETMYWFRQYKQLARDAIVSAERDLASARERLRVAEELLYDIMNRAAFGGPAWRHIEERYSAFRKPP